MGFKDVSHHLNPIAMQYWAAFVLTVQSSLPSKACSGPPGSMGPWGQFEDALDWAQSNVLFFLVFHKTFFMIHGIREFRIINNVGNQISFFFFFYRC